MVFNFEEFKVEVVITANVTDNLKRDACTVDPMLKQEPSFFGKNIKTSLIDMANVIPGERPIQ